MFRAGATSAVQRPGNCLGPQQFINLSIIYLVFFVPFFFAACCIGLAFTCRPSYIGRIYFFDMLGAGLGAMLIVGLLFLLSVQNALIVLAILALLASALMGFTSTIRKPLFVMHLACLATFLFGLPQDWLTLRISEYKGLNQTMQVSRQQHFESFIEPPGTVDGGRKPADTLSVRAGLEPQHPLRTSGATRRLSAMATA